MHLSFLYLWCTCLSFIGCLTKNLPAFVLRRSVCSVPGTVLRPAGFFDGDGAKFYLSFENGIETQGNDFLRQKKCFNWFLREITYVCCNCKLSIMVMNFGSDS